MNHRFYLLERLQDYVPATNVQEITKAVSDVQKCLAYLDILVVERIVWLLIKRFQL